MCRCPKKVETFARALFGECLSVVFFSTLVACRTFFYSPRVFSQCLFIGKASTSVSLDCNGAGKRQVVARPGISICNHTVSKSIWN